MNVFELSDLTLNTLARMLCTAGPEISHTPETRTPFAAESQLEAFQVRPHPTVSVRIFTTSLWELRRRHRLSCCIPIQNA